MAGQKQGGGQKQRTHKISEGKRRSSRPIPLTRLQLALLGKGPTNQAAVEMNRRAGLGDKRSKAFGR